MATDSRKAAGRAEKWLSDNGYVLWRNPDGYISERLAEYEAATIERCALTRAENPQDTNLKSNPATGRNR